MHGAANNVQQHFAGVEVRVRSAAFTVLLLGAHAPRQGRRRHHMRLICLASALIYTAGWKAVCTTVPYLYVLQLQPRCASLAFVQRSQDIKKSENRKARVFAVK